MNIFSRRAAALWGLLVVLLFAAACTSGSKLSAVPSDTYTLPLTVTDSVSAAAATVTYDSSALAFQKATAGSANIEIATQKAGEGRLAIALIAKNGSAGGNLATLSFKKIAASGGSAAIANFESAPAVAAPVAQARAITLSYAASDIVATLADYELGDVQQNNTFDIADLGQFNESAAGALSAAGQILADFDGNGAFNTTDRTLALAKFVARLGGAASDANLIVHPNSSQTLASGDTLVIVVYNNGETDITAPTLSPATGVTQLSNEVAGHSYAFQITGDGTTQTYTISTGQAGVNSPQVTVAGSGGGTGGGEDGLTFVDASGTSLASLGTLTPSPCIINTITISTTLMASGGTEPYEFTLAPGFLMSADLPGLTLNSETGVLSGILTDAPSQSVTFQVVDQNNKVDTAQATLLCGEVLTLDYSGGAASNPNTTSTDDDNTITVTASEGGMLGAVVDLSDAVAVSCSVDALPSGLSLDPSTCAITGTLDSGTAANSPYTATITATSGDGQTATVVMTINALEAPKLVNANFNIAIESTADDEAFASGAEDTPAIQGGTNATFTVDLNDDGDGTDIDEDLASNDTSFAIDVTTDASGDIDLTDGTSFDKCELLNTDGTAETLAGFSAAKSTATTCTIAVTTINGDTVSESGDYIVRVYDSAGAFVDVPVELTLLEPIEVAVTDSDVALINGASVSYVGADNNDYTPPVGGVSNNNTSGFNGGSFQAVAAEQAVDTAIVAKSVVDIEATATKGKAGYTIQLEVGGGNLTEAALSPANLALNAGNVGTLTGNLTLPSSSSSINGTLTVKATDDYGAENNIFKLTVNLYPELDVACTGQRFTIYTDTARTTTNSLRDVTNRPAAQGHTIGSGTNEEYQCNIQGGSGSYTVTSVGGTLPGGISVVDAANPLVGTPTLGTAGTFNNLQIQVEDASGAIVKSNVFGMDVAAFRVKAEGDNANSKVGIHQGGDAGANDVDDVILFDVKIAASGSEFIDITPVGVGAVTINSVSFTGYDATGGCGGAVGKGSEAPVWVNHTTAPNIATHPGDTDLQDNSPATLGYKAKLDNSPATKLTIKESGGAPTRGLRFLFNITDDLGANRTQSIGVCVN